VAEVGKNRDPLCVRFVNTVDWRDDPGRRVDNLASYSDLVLWARDAAAITPSTAAKLIREANRAPADSQTAFSHAMAVRESIASVLSAAAFKKEPIDADLQLVNAALAECGRHLNIGSGSGRFHYTWDSDDHLDRVLWPIVRSAGDLLTSPVVERLRLCEGEGCGWFFMDNTRNRSRRWCNMAVCGNRAKVKRFYERHRLQ